MQHVCHFTEISLIESITYEPLVPSNQTLHIRISYE